MPLRDPAPYRHLQTRGSLNEIQDLILPELKLLLELVYPCRQDHGQIHSTLLA